MEDVMDLFSARRGFDFDNLPDFLLKPLTFIST